MSKAKKKPKAEEQTYCVWLLYSHSGWWLQESGYDMVSDAVAGLGEKLAGMTAANECIGGAVLPDGKTP